MKKDERTLIFDGVKAVPPWDFDSDVGWVNITGDENLSGADLYYARVPWLFRAVRDRANNVAHMPWFLVKGENDWEDFQAYENKLGWLKNPRRILHLVEQSLCITSSAYLFLETNTSGYIKGVQYCNPYTITEVYDSNHKLTGFKRRVGSAAIEYPASNFVAIYDPDYMSETGAGKTSAAGAAIAAAGVLYNSSAFITQFFRRGAIKATVLTAQNASQPEAERLQKWWEDVIQGIRNAWSAIVLRSDNVKATTIGEGLESLQNESLTKEQRQEIAAALGVPESRMWSAAANYATREMDEKAYFEGTIIPECDLIAEAFNEQVFIKEHKLDGIYMETRAETLDIFQVDNAQQAQAYQMYINAGMKPSVAAQVLGIELPADMEYEDLDPEEKPEPEPETLQPIEEQPVPVANEQEIRSILKAWRRKAELALKKSGSAMVEFETNIIPAVQQKEIRTALALAKTNDEIKAAFEIEIPEGEMKSNDEELKAIADKLNESWAMLKGNMGTTIKQGDIVIPPAPAPVFNYTPPPVYVTVEPAQNIINMPEQPAPIVNIPQQPAPIVKIEPAKVEVKPIIKIDQSAQKIKVERDNNGKIVGLSKTNG